MVFLIVHNEYSNKGGEESVVAFQKELLERHGYQVILYTRNYHEADNWFMGKAWTTITSVYNKRSIKDLKRIIEQYNPEVAIIHNVFSIISPAIIPFLNKNNIKVWQIVHNYRMFCPIGIFYSKGEICEKCLAKGREWNCWKNHCTGNKLSDFTFSWKFAQVRKRNYYKDVDRFYVLSNLQKKKLIANSIPEEKIYFLPNAYNGEVEEEIKPIEKKNYISFAGRLTKEKGFYDFLKLASMLPEYSFCVAGDEKLVDKNIDIPSNVEFKGLLAKEEMYNFYKSSKVQLFLSKWYETFGLVVIEAMAKGTPVIVYDVSAAAEIVKDGENGFVVKTGDLNAVVEKIKLLCEDKSLYESMSISAKQRVRNDFSVEKYYERLMQEEK